MQLSMHIQKYHVSCRSKQIMYFALQINATCMALTQTYMGSDQYLMKHKFCCKHGFLSLRAKHNKCKLHTHNYVLNEYYTFAITFRHLCFAHVVDAHHTVSFSKIATVPFDSFSSATNAVARTIDAPQTVSFSRMATVHFDSFFSAAKPDNCTASS